MSRNPMQQGHRSQRHRETATTARQRAFALSGEYLFTVVSAWLIPGVGHFLLGYRVRGLILGVSILGLFWVGQALAVPLQNPSLQDQRRYPLAVSREVNPVFFACQVGNGLSTLLANHRWGRPLYPNQNRDNIDRELPRSLNLAILFTSVSGLLNYLLLLHILDPRTWTQAKAEDEPLRGPLQ